MTRILMAEATDFRGPTQVGSHALAREFARAGADVFWLGTPLHPGSLIRNRAGHSRHRIDAWKRGAIRADDRILEYYPMTWLPVVDRPVFRTRAAAARTLRATTPPLAGVLRSRGFDSPDVLWLSNSRFSHALPSLVKARVRACRISDDWEHFGHVPPALIALHDEMVDACDVVFVTSKRLQEKLDRRRPDAIYLPNAVADFFFSPPGAEPAMLSAFARPRVVFVGKLDAWIDFDAIARVGEKLPHASVLVVGPGEPAARRYPPNVHFTGAFPYRELPSLLAACDVGLVPFLRNELTRAVSPLKLFEYLACGLPGVATRLDEIEASRAPVSLVDSAEDFPDAVAALLDGGGPDRTSLISFARDNTWSRRFDSVRDALRRCGVDVSNDV
jgi:glycosyltransferase involved in cell wall biosynthesis